MAGLSDTLDHPHEISFLTSFCPHGSSFFVEHEASAAELVLTEVPFQSATSQDPV